MPGQRICVQQGMVPRETQQEKHVFLTPINSIIAQVYYTEARREIPSFYLSANISIGVPVHCY